MTMTVLDLQRALRARGFDPGPPDGVYGGLTRAAVLAALTDGPDRPLTDEDVELAAIRLDVTARAVRTVARVEAAGAGFIAGRPTILFEPHRFSKATGGRFDATHPSVSYRSWGARPYPPRQAQRYDQLLEAVGLDVDAGFASASWGAFQILGENHAVCGFASPFAFAYAQATGEADQLDSFVEFVRGRGLDGALRRGDWAAFARGYNGSGYRENRYDEKLAAAWEALG